MAACHPGPRLVGDPGSSFTSILSPFKVTFLPLTRLLSMKDEIEEKLLMYRLEATQDPEAFSTLYTHYYPAIYRFILFRVSNRDVAHDVAADVFLKLWTHVIERRKVTHFRALAYRIARNTVVDHYRTVRPTISLEDAEMFTPMTEDLGITIGGAIDREVVTHAVMGLDPDDMELIMLFYAQGLRVKEIATIVNKREGAVRVQLHRIRKLLREKIGENI